MREKVEYIGERTQLEIGPIFNRNGIDYNISEELGSIYINCYNKEKNNHLLTLQICQEVRENKVGRSIDVRIEPGLGLDRNTKFNLSEEIDHIYEVEKVIENEELLEKEGYSRVIKIRENRVEDDYMVMKRSLMYIMKLLTDTQKGGNVRKSR